MVRRRASDSKAIITNNESKKALHFLCPKTTLILRDVWSGISRAAAPHEGGSVVASVAPLVRWALVAFQPA